MSFGGNAGAFATFAVAVQFINQGTYQGPYSALANTATNQNTTATNQNTGAGSGENMPPFLVTNYIIKAVADIARGGWYTQSSPPVVTQLPTNPALGEEVYYYNPTTTGYQHQRWTGSGWTTFNDSAAFSYDANGRIRKPFQPLFSGSHSGAINVTNVTLNSSNCFDTISYNNGNCFNASTGRLTAPAAGYYYASAHFGAASIQEINCRIRLNGSANTGPLAELWNQGGNGASNVMAAAIIFCNVNDYIDFEAARVNCLNGVQHKRMLVYLLQ
jgi:hypothetical protein